MNRFMARGPTWWYFPLQCRWSWDLVDVNAPWAMKDKLQHVLLGCFALIVYREWCGHLYDRLWLGFALEMVFALLVAILCELIEGARFRRYGWTRALSDVPDVADVAWTLAGALTAYNVLAIVAWLGRLA